MRYDIYIYIYIYIHYIYIYVIRRLKVKGILKFTLKQLLHVSVQSPSSGSVLFELAKVIVISLWLVRWRGCICRHATEPTTTMYMQPQPCICNHTTEPTTTMYFN